MANKNTGKEQTSSEKISYDEAYHILYEVNAGRDVLDKEDRDAIEKQVKPSKLVYGGIYTTILFFGALFVAETVKMGSAVYRDMTMDSQIATLQENRYNLKRLGSQLNNEEIKIEEEKILSQIDALNKKKMESAEERKKLFWNMFIEGAMILNIAPLIPMYKKQLAQKKVNLSVEMYREKYASRDRNM